MGSVILVIDFNILFGLEMVDFELYVKFKTKSAHLTCNAF